jgi:hypothetical protein
LFLSFCQLMARPSMNVNSAGDVPRQKKKLFNSQLLPFLSLFYPSINGAQ